MSNNIFLSSETFGKYQFQISFYGKAVRQLNKFKLIKMFVIEVFKQSAIFDDSFEQLERIQVESREQTNKIYNELKLKYGVKK